ncbi:MAG: transposase [Patescibacteria group bacterium]|nr:transposase [Patescibacteria group bacterium]
MNQTRSRLSNIWNHFQTTLFPWLQEELGELTGKQKQLVEVLELVQIEAHLPYVGQVPGRPPESRSAIARAFIAKAVYNLPTTEVLRDQLESNIKLRRLCGWEKKNDVPSSSTFSRAFAEFAENQLAERVHAVMIEKHLGDQLIGHISRDSTAIVAREKPIKAAAKKESKPKKRGRPKKGEERIKEPTRLERQSAGMSLSNMQADLPSVCNVGTKRNSKGYKTTWIGYKLHIDASDGGIPISCLLTSASLHDSQVAIPLAEMTSRRVTNCYDLMDAAYDSPLIKQHSQSLGHVPLIDENPRNKKRKAEIEEEQKRRRKTGFKLAEDIRYNERSTVERVNGRLKDEFNARMVRVKGHAKVMAHLMFGIITLTANQLMKFLE